MTVSTAASPVRGLIFDFDGLILDTEGPDYHSWQEVYAEHGVELTIDAWGDCVGARAGVFDAFTHLEDLTGRRLDRGEIVTSRTQRFHRLVEMEALRPGVAAYLEAARRLGLRRAVASSADRAWVEGHLTRLGILDRFDCIRTADDVPRAKPAPDLFLAACRCAGVKPHEAIAFEDSVNGIRAAKAAGLFCVAVPNGVTGRMDLGEADRVVASLADLPLESLLAQVQRDGRSR